MIKTLTLISHLFAGEMTCLADNIYHEARAEQAHGQMMVALVTLKRATLEGGVCKAVYRKHQFSWTRYKPKINDLNAYRQSKAIAKEAVFTALYDGIDDIVDHYYAHNKVLPAWSKYGTNIQVIGNHTFMKVGEK